MPRTGSLGITYSGDPIPTGPDTDIYLPENISAPGLNDIIADLMSQGIEREGGGALVLPRATLDTSEPIQARRHVWIRGQGPGSLIRPADAGFDDSVWSAAVVNGDDADRRFGIFDFAIDATNVQTGVHFNTPDVAQDEFADGIYNVERIEVFDAIGEGFHVEGRGASIILGCRTRDVGGAGYLIEAPDMILDGIEAAASGEQGIVIRATNTRLSKSKAFFSGRLVPTLGYGLHMDGTDGDRHAVVENCDLQDNNHHGLYVDGYSRLDATGIISEGNNAGNYGMASQGASAYHVRAASGVTIAGKALARATNTHQQQYAIALQTSADALNAMLFSAGNAVGHINAGSITKTNIVINSYLGLQTISHAATITPDPTNGRKMVIGTITAPITIANPETPNFAYGHELIIEVRQNGVGGHGVTWGNQFKLPAGVTPNTGPNFANIYTFMRVSSGWVLTCPITSIDLT